MEVWLALHLLLLQHHRGLNKLQLSVQLKSEGISMGAIMHAAMIVHRASPKPEVGPKNNSTNPKASTALQPNMPNLGAHEDKSRPMPIFDDSPTNR